MPHKLEKFYSSFGGVDTRSNKLIADPRTFRKGSKNFRYNFQDEIQNANGWQHKTEDTPVSFVDIFEYKYRDVNTGESKSQVLAVGVDGNLYRKVQHTLKWLATGAATSYSFFYDEVDDTFKMTVNGVGSVNISESMTLNQLKTALNALTGITVDIVDNDGNSVTSSKLAYLLDVRIEDNFNLNSSWFWERVLFPDITCVSVSSITTTNFNPADTSQYTTNSVPFKTALASHADPKYEGISSVNINNSIYITDGGFPLKYDGKAVYRAGVPKSVMIKVSNRTVSIPPFGTITPYETITGQEAVPISPISGSSALPNGYYGYKFRFAFTDYNGFTSYGDIVEDVQGPQITPFPTSTQNYQVRNRGYWYGKDFPIFAARVNGSQGPGTSGGPYTITVHAGHNIVPGMVVRQITRTSAATTINTTSKAIINFYARVTAVTATSISLEETVCTAGDQAYTSGFLDGEIINAYFVQDFYINKRPFQYYSQTTINPAGAYLEVYRTKVGATADAAKISPYYHVYNMPVPFINGDRATVIDDKLDSALTELLDDQTIGGELPRACSYLTKWQDCITQAGSPFDTLLKNDHYPSIFYVDTPITYCQEAIDTLSFYSESMLCDPQSIYWNDPITPEGFPQDGLHEFSIDTEYNDAIKGIAPNKDALFAIKERSTGILTGDLGTNDIVLEVLEDDIGLASHKTLQQTKGALIWLDPIKGFYACVAGRLPQHIGYPICDYMQINAEKLDYSKAAAMNARAIGMYICVVGSTWFVYDYSDTQNGSRNCWYIWERFSSKSALFTAESEILLLADKVWKMKVTNTRFDMTDHKDAIQMDARQAWWNGGLPTIDKVFERLWANSIQGGFTLSIDQYANYLDDRIASIDVGFKEAPKKTVKDYAKAAIPKLSAISFGLRNAEKNKLVRIQGFEIEYAPDFYPSEPRR